jgi:hypothetical protein
MKKLFLFVLALSVCASAAEGSLENRVDGLQAQIDRAMSKAGIHFNGEFRSQFLNSSLGGDAVDNGKKNESVEYTSVDFDIVARPNTALSAHAVFRLHQDWRNFFSDVQNPISTRWLSIDGTLMKGIVKYNLGDFQKKLTPLTLWSPDIEFLYEPEIFAENRKLAMSEAFVGDNLRALQGGNIEFAAEVGTSSSTILQELYVDLFGARLTARGTGESGVIPPGVASAPNGEYWNAPYDRYLVGVNVATQFIKGAGIGLTNISMFDNVASYDGDSTAARLDPARVSNNVFAGRLNADNRMFMDDDAVSVGVGFEAALSSNKKFYPDPGNAAAVLDSSVAGMGVNVGLNARFAAGEDNVIRLSADFVHNNTEFKSDAAQGPSFLQRTVMNNENSLQGLGLLNPFDALYRSVFKYSPSQYFGGARPFTKNAYNNAILTADQAAAIGGVYEYPSVFQTALPGGMASSNRTGPVIKLDGSFLDKGVTVGIKAVAVQTIGEMEVKISDDQTIYQTDDDGNTVFDEDGNPIIWSFIPGEVARFNPQFLEFVGGASFDIAKFAPAVGPSLEIGGSYGIYNAKYGDNLSNESGLMSAFVNYNFVPRFSLLFGYQRLATVVKNDGNETSALTFDNLSAGLCYKVADGGALTVKITRLSGNRDDKINPGANTGYNAMQPEVYLTVKF